MPVISVTIVMPSSRSESRQSVICFFIQLYYRLYVVFVLYAVYSTPKGEGLIQPPQGLRLYTQGEHLPERQSIATSSLAFAMQARFRALEA